MEQIALAKCHFAVPGKKHFEWRTQFKPSNARATNNIDNSWIPFSVPGIVNAESLASTGTELSLMLLAIPALFVLLETC